MCISVNMFVRLFLVCGFCYLVSCDNGMTDKYYSVYQTADKIRDEGFPAETHNVTTSDGYILEMHRIPSGRRIQVKQEDRPVVFLMHGLLSASNAFIRIGPEFSFAYNLADAGFDVWMGNARGNKNSRFHTTLNPDDELEKFAFFDFSFEEIGMLDLPAMIDYILAYTGKDKLHYIGHSQGGTVFLVMASMVPEYNQKLASVHLLAGVGYVDHFPREDLKETAQMTDLIYGYGLQMGAVELYPPNSTAMLPEDLFPGGLFPRKSADYCAGNMRRSHSCRLFSHKARLREGALDVSLPGASLKTIAHYGQNIRDKMFRRFHHGDEGNQNLYGSPVPPAYNLSLITSFVTMHYTLNDDLLDEKDVIAMVFDMPNAVARQVSRQSFEHSDFVEASDAKELVTDYIIEEINKVDQGNIINIDDGSGIGPSETETEELPPNTEIEPITDSPDVIETPVTEASIEQTTPGSAHTAGPMAILSLIVLTVHFLIK